jgi:hypothetical protein
MNSAGEQAVCADASLPHAANSKHNARRTGQLIETNPDFTVDKL